jgi:hypothetical protein
MSKDTPYGPMKTCTTCKADVHPLEEFPGGICLDCHAKKVSGQDAEQAYRDIMHGFGEGGIFN